MNSKCLVLILVGLTWSLTVHAQSIKERLEQARQNEEAPAEESPVPQPEASPQAKAGCPAERQAAMYEQLGVLIREEKKETDAVNQEISQMTVGSKSGMHALSKEVLTKDHPNLGYLNDDDVKTDFAHKKDALAYKRKQLEEIAARYDQQQADLKEEYADCVIEPLINAETPAAP